jgi:hypothetical protein
MVAGPIGDLNLPIVNWDGLPSVYSLCEAWFGDGNGNTALRAQVVPAAAPDPIDPPNTGRWEMLAQDPTGKWLVPLRNGRLSVTKTDQLVAQPAVASDSSADQLPQWMPVGVATQVMFAAVGLRSEDDQIGTTWLVTTTGLGSLSRIQDILNGDSRFSPVTNSAPLAGRTVAMAPPFPTISGPGPEVTEGIVKCAMTQNGDDSATLTLHSVAINGRSLLHSAFSDFGPVSQVITNLAGGLFTNSFNRFRSVTRWANALPADYGDLFQVAVAATGADNILHVFFVGKTYPQGSDVFRLWHTKRFPNGSWTVPVDVLRESGESLSGTPYQTYISAKFCPAYGDMLGTQPKELLLTIFLPDNMSIYVQEVERKPKLWNQYRFPSIYSPWWLVHSGVFQPSGSQGNFWVPFRVRLSTRPFSDM